MSTLFARGNAIMALAATVALLGKEAYFYKLDASNQAIAIAAATDVPNGLILATTVDGLEISAAVLGGNHGPCRVKLGADVTDLRKDLVLRADGSVGPDTGDGARVIVARPLETGTAGEEIQAVLLPPRALPAAVALTSTDGTAAAAADLAGLKAETENIGDDVRAIKAALAAVGILS